MINLGPNKQGVALSAKRINKGDTYGRTGKLVYDRDDPLILFYRTVTKDRPTSHIATYYRSILMGECKVFNDNYPAHIYGLCLCGATRLSATADQVLLACMGESQYDTQRAMGQPRTGQYSDYMRTSVVYVG